MNFYNTATGKTVSQRQVVKDNPNTSFSLPLSDATLVSLGLLRLASDPKPAHDEDTQVVVDGPIEVRGDTAYQTYTVVDMSDESKAVVAQRKKDAIIAQIASRRYNAEVEGVVTDEATGFKLDTSRETRAILDSVIAWMESQTSITTVPWKHLDGTFEDLDIDGLKAVRQIVAIHVATCYQNEKELREALENGTYTEAMLQEKFPVELPIPVVDSVDTPVQ